MKITHKARPIVVGEAPAVDLEGGGTDRNACVRITVTIPGTRADVCMSPEEARDFASIVIVAAYNENLRFAAEQQARGRSLIESVKS